MHWWPPKVDTLKLLMNMTLQQSNMKKNMILFHLLKWILVGEVKLIY